MDKYELDKAIELSADLQHRIQSLIWTALKSKRLLVIPFPVALLWLRSTKHIAAIFHSNRRVLEMYKQSDAYREGDSEIVRSVGLLNDILEGKQSSTDTPFQAPMGPPSGWNENAWTRRLIPGVRTILPECTVTCMTNPDIKSRSLQ